MKKAPRKILVSLKEASEAEELMGLATHVAAPRSAKISVLHVVEVPPATPLDAQAAALEAPARAIEKAVKRAAGKHPRRSFPFRVLRARHAGKAIADELREGKYELAIIGYHHKRSFDELILGTTANYLASRAPCRLLMSVPPRG